MNKFASFKFEDAKSINALLEKYPLAGGTNVFASEGKLILQYQDGEDEPAAVQAINLKEQIRVFQKNKEEILHSNRVMDTLVADAESRVAVAEADISRIELLIDAAENARAKKPFRDELELAEKTLKMKKGALHEVKSQRLINENEIARIDLNIEYFNEKVATLTK